MRPFILGLVVLATLYLLLIAAAWAGQERIVWQPPHLDSYPEPGARRITYSAEDDQPLYAYLVGDPTRATGLLVAFHGNAELAAWNVPWAAEVARRTGWAVLVPEYRGYGGLAGSPSYGASQRDARAAYLVAREQLGVDSSRIAFYGHSLGSAVASELAAEHAPSALVLVAPFTSARDMAGEMRVLPFSELWRVIGRVHFDTRAKVAALDVPVSVAQGERDVVIPVRMGRAVHAAARRQGELLIVPEAGHNDVMNVSGSEYWSWLQRALAGASTRASSRRRGSTTDVH
jgi:pimeloyl-ACP methyl ester carboxylesterase